MELPKQVKDAIEEFYACFLMNEQIITTVEFNMDYNILATYLDTEEK